MPSKPGAVPKSFATFGGLSTVQQVRYRGLRALAKVFPFLRWEPERSGVADIIPALLLLTLDIDRQYYKFAMAKSAELLQGTLDLLILRTLEPQPLHGVGIADRIEQVTDGVFVVGPGSLFPALHRLAERGWIEGQWGELDSGRRAKCYTLTPAGRKQLAQEKRNWRRVITAVTQVLGEEG